MRGLLVTLLLCPVAAQSQLAFRYSYLGQDERDWSAVRLPEGPPAGAGPDYTTYIGDSWEYRTARIVADVAGNTYVTGGRLIPAGDGQNFTQDIFVTKLSPGGAILFTATIGGKGLDQANGLALDPAENVVVVGQTNSPNFPLRGAIQAQRGSSQTGFVLKLSPDGRLLASSYFGGIAAPSAVNAVATDASGNIYVTGYTNARDFPATSRSGPAPFVGLGSIGVAFTAKLPPAADRVTYAGWISGAGVDCGAGSSCFLSGRITSGVAIGVDRDGNVVVGGNTNTPDLATSSGALLEKGIGAFVAKYTSDGRLAFLTHLGARNDPFAPFADPGTILTGLIVDRASGEAIVVGRTNDEKFPATPGVVQPVYSGPDAPPRSFPAPQRDAFAVRLKADGSGVRWGTFLGGRAADTALDVAADSAGRLWITGTTDSGEFPNSQGWAGGGKDFVVGLSDAGASLVYSARFPANTVATSVAVDARGVVHVAGESGVVSALVPGADAGAHVWCAGNAAGGTLWGRIAPGQIVSLFGPGIGPASPASFTLDASGRIPSTLSGVRVRFGGGAAPLLYVSATQINVIVPKNVTTDAETEITVSRGDGTTLAGYRVVIVPVAPGIFTKPDGSAAALNQDGSLNSAASPARAGEIVSIWATGTGAPAESEDTIARIAASRFCCTVVVDAQAATVVYSGPSPGLTVAATQLNIRLPGMLAGGGTSSLEMVTAGRRSIPVRLFTAP